MHLENYKVLTQRCLAQIANLMHLKNLTSKRRQKLVVGDCPNRRLDSRPRPRQAESKYQFHDRMWEPSTSQSRPTSISVLPNVATCSASRSGSIGIVVAHPTPFHSFCDKIFVRSVRSRVSAVFFFFLTPCRDGHGGCACDMDDQQRKERGKKKEPKHAC